MTNLVSPTVGRILLFFLLYIVAAFLAAIIIERSISTALKSLRLALKSEFTTDSGRINFGAMILFAFVILVFNLHDMMADALKAGDATSAQDHVTGPAVLLGLFFFGVLDLCHAGRKQETIAGGWLGQLAVQSKHPRVAYLKMLVEWFTLSILTGGPLFAWAPLRASGLPIAEY